MKGITKSFVFILAAASGAPSAVYQIVWMRRLSLVFGITTLQTSTVLAIFLGGMAIGSWIWGRLADRRPQFALIVFAAIQIATGIYAFASLWIFGGVETLYLAAGRSLADRTGLFAGLQFALSVLIILPPVILLGGSLPLLARRMVSESSGIVGAVGAIYGWNMLGAAFGVVATVYFLLPTVGLTSAVALAATVNVLVGVAAFAAGMSAEKRPEMPYAAAAMSSGMTDFSPNVIKFLVLIAFALSGVAATTFELGWGRLLAMVMGPSVYAYGTPAVIVLAGLGMGSILYGVVQRTTEEHQQRFTFLEFLIAFTATLSLMVLPRIPVLFVRFFPLFRDSFGRQAAMHFIAAAMVALVPSVLFGAAFPAAVASLGGAAVRVGQTIGTAYAANTLGAAVGVCVAELVLIPAVGLHATMTLAVLVMVAAGSIVWWRIRAPRLRRLQALAPAVAALLSVGMMPTWPREVFAAGIGFVAPRLGTNEKLSGIVRGMRLLYYRDGRNATISVDQTGHTLVFRSNGRTVTSTDPVDMADQLLRGHLPILLHPAPSNVLILGLGTGITAAAVARYPVRQIDIVEVEPAVAQAARLFDSYTHKVLDDPRVQLIIGDGRNRLLGARKQYDIVISDPSDVWVAGSGSLATLEFYRIVGARLKPGGIFAQCIHTRALLPEDLDLLTATFQAVFPHLQIWTSAPGNLLLLGSRDPVAWDYTRLKQHFARTPGVADDLRLVGIWHPFALFGAQLLGEKESDELAGGIGEFHIDDRPVLEFRTPRSLYVETAPMIVEQLNSFRGPDPPMIAGFDPRRDLDADGAYLLGFSYASVGRSNLAIKYMELSTTMAPNHPMFFVGLGNQYRAVGRVPDARTAYERALALDLNNVEALVSLGEIRLEEGQLDWTRVLSDRALRLAPQDARVHALIDKLQEVER